MSDTRDFKASNGYIVFELADGQVCLTKPIAGSAFEQKMWMRPDEAAAIAEYLSRPAVAARPLPDRETVELTVHQTLAPNWMSVISALGSQEHYNEFLSDLADAVLSLFTTDTTEENPNG